MKRYIRSNKLLKSNPGKNLAEAFIAECKPYTFKLFKEYDDAYEIVGVANYMEPIPELIQLVENVCKYYNIEFFDAHFAQGDKGDFIIFKILKQ